MVVFCPGISIWSEYLEAASSAVLISVIYLFVSLN